MNRMKKTLIILICVILCASCHKTQPQLPSNKVPKKDSAELALMELNFRMAEAADREITAIVKNISCDTISYTLDETGFWYRKTRHSADTQSTLSKELDIHIQVFDMEDVLLFDSHEHITVGKHESAWCVDEAVQMMQHGDEMEILSPWYTGFGRLGNEYIPAYTNIKIKLSI